MLEKYVESWSLRQKQNKGRKSSKKMEKMETEVLEAKTMANKLF